MLPAIALLMIGLTTHADPTLPGPPQRLAEFPTAWSDVAPGAFDASGLLDKPAGRNGPVVVKGEHFYTGDRRIRFWGVNIAFGGNFPPHESADALAVRLARFGINAVRLHHMDNRPYPGGLFADEKLEKISPEALDRLDYLVAAFKRQGIYVDINLHVSRKWSESHGWENAKKLPEDDKIVDLFYPPLIDAQKQFAKDLLTHVNAYTHEAYAQESAVCCVEITNEDSMFLWGGERRLAEMPEPYIGELQKQWNAWLVKKYATRAALADAWGKGAQASGEEMLKDAPFAKVNGPAGPWSIEQHEKTRMTLTPATAAARPALKVVVQAVDGTDWHLQLSQGRLALKKGQSYTVRFSGRAEKAGLIDVGVGQAHEPWNNLGLTTGATLGPEEKEFVFGFTATADEDNARLSFSVGRQATTLWLSGASLRTGGLAGLRDEEDPTRSNVARGGAGRLDTPLRGRDWYAFLQATDQAYFVEMRRYLKEELKVACPVTGTIGLGPLGTLSQAKMDFVDAHSYWDHPSFPRKSWDSKDWLIANKPMVDSPAKSAHLPLIATRVAGKPFTVTEYNHAAPNEWQAECIPMLATVAALQDWDGVFLFAYSHNLTYDKQKMSSFFDIDGNPLKMNVMPSGARIFLGGAIQPSSPQIAVATEDQLLD